MHNASIIWNIFNIRHCYWFYSISPFIGDPLQQSFSGLMGPSKRDMAMAFVRKRPSSSPIHPLLVRHQVDTCHISFKFIWQKARCHTPSERASKMDASNMDYAIVATRLADVCNNLPLHQLKLHQLMQRIDLCSSIIANHRQMQSR